MTQMHAGKYVANPIVYIPFERWDEFKEFAEEHNLDYNWMGLRGVADVEITAQDDRTLKLAEEFRNIELRNPTDYFCPACGEISRLTLKARETVVHVTLLRNDLKTRVNEGFRTLVKLDRLQTTVHKASNRKVIEIGCLACRHTGSESEFTQWRWISKATSIEQFPKVLTSELKALQRLAKKKMDELEGEINGRE